MREAMALGTLCVKKKSENYSDHTYRALEPRHAPLVTSCLV